MAEIPMKWISMKKFSTQWDGSVYCQHVANSSIFKT